MRNIMKAQLYQLRRNKLIYIVFVVLVIMQCTTLMGEIGFSTDIIPAGDYMAENGFAVMSIALLFATVLTGDICGADFVDKTTNYELMSGHLRKEVYFGRAILSIVIGTVGVILLNLLPLVIAYLLGGWGENLDFGGVMLRYLLALFPIMRLLCEFVFLSYVIKNAYIVMAIGVAVSLVGSVWVEIFCKGNAFLLGFGNLYKLFEFTSWKTFTLVGEKEILIYDATLSTGEIMGTVFLSLLAGGLFLVLGYVFFAKDDLN